MAHIALITKDFHPQVQTLAKALQNQRHQITLITQKNQDIPSDFEGQVLRPFEKWSAWEAARLVPRLISQIPDVWHFVFSEEEETLTSAHWLLSQFARSIPHKIVVGTFFSEVDHNRRWRLSPFLANCDLITTGQRETLMYLKREFDLKKSTVLDILPPLDTEAKLQNLEKSVDDDILRLTNALGRYFYVPGSPEEFKRKNLDFSFLKKSAADYKLVFSSPRKKSSTEFISVGHLNSSQLNQLISQSRGLLLAFHDLSLLELQNYSYLSAKAKAPLLIRPIQNEILPGLCKSGKNGWILEQGPHTLQQILLTNPELNISRAEIGEGRLNLMDSTLNELQRLYQKAYHNRWA